MERRKQNPIYMTRKEIGELVGYSYTAVDNRLAEIRKHQEEDPSRYRYPFNGSRVHVGVFIDWCANRTVLMDSRTAKHVPPFNVYESLAYAGVLTSDASAMTQK